MIWNSAGRYNKYIDIFWCICRTIYKNDTFYSNDNYKRFRCFFFLYQGIAKIEDTLDNHNNNVLFCMSKDVMFEDQNENDKQYILL